MDIKPMYNWPYIRKSWINGIEVIKVKMEIETLELKTELKLQSRIS